MDNYTYNKNGNNKQVTDVLGQVIQSIDPLGNKITYAYDPADNRIRKTDAKGATIQYTYNEPSL